MKGTLSTALKFPVDSFGYIEPGHRLKGKQRWLVQDQDVMEMYVCYEGKTCCEIMLWYIQPSCEQFGVNARKRPSSGSRDD